MTLAILALHIMGVLLFSVSIKLSITYKPFIVSVIMLSGVAPPYLLKDFWPIFPGSRVAIHKTSYDNFMVVLNIFVSKWCQNNDTQRNDIQHNNK
jgi:hypothetical protein